MESEFQFEKAANEGSELPVMRFCGDCLFKKKKKCCKSYKTGKRCKDCPKKK